jgi:hypothetical protein
VSYSDRPILTGLIARFRCQGVTRFQGRWRPAVRQAFPCPSALHERLHLDSSALGTHALLRSNCGRYVSMHLLEKEADVYGTPTTTMRRSATGIADNSDDLWRWESKPLSVRTELWWQVLSRSDCLMEQPTLLIPASRDKYTRIHHCILIANADNSAACRFVRSRST